MVVYGINVYFRESQAFWICAMLRYRSKAKPHPLRISLTIPGETHSCRSYHRKATRENSYPRSVAQQHRKHSGIPEYGDMEQMAGHSFHTNSIWAY